MKRYLNLFVILFLPLMSSYGDITVGGNLVSNVSGANAVVAGGNIIYNTIKASSADPLLEMMEVDEMGHVTRKSVPGFVGEKSIKRVLLLTANTTETQCLHAVAKKANLDIKMMSIGDQTVYRFGKIGNIEVWHLQPPAMGMLNPGNTPYSIMKVFPHIKPNYLIAVGIAFGIESKHKLGDILVSRSVFAYEAKKETNERIYYRGDRATSTMMGNIETALHTWKGVKVRSGLIASGNTLVNSQKFLKRLLTQEPELVGGDMETFSLYSIAAMEENCKWVMIKGISDWGNGTKNDNYHEIAATNAAEFTMYLLRKGNM